MSDIFIGRQPIYTRDLDVYAYELMTHSSDRGDTAKTRPVSLDRAVSQIIINAFMDIGLERLVGDKVAFITLSEHFLQSDYELPIPVNRVIFKVPINVRFSEPMLKGCQRLVDQGFTLALGNYLQTPALEPLVELARLIHIDVQELEQAQIAEYLTQLQKKHSVILADHVNSYEKYEVCRDVGVSYIQGYFLNRPKIISGKALQPNQVSVMNLLATLYSPEVDTDAIVSAITNDVALSYKILQLMNSAFFSRSSKIDSIQHAIVMLGRKQLCSWASVMAMSGMDDKPLEQLRIAMIRAHSCERLAEEAKLDHADSFFTVGLLSSLDLLMDKALAEAIQPLPLTENIVTALLTHSGEMGEALACTLAYETGTLRNAHFADLSQQQLTDINIESINWAEDILKNIQK